MIEVVRVRGEALRFASPRLRADDEVIGAAILSEPSAKFFVLPNPSEIVDPKHNR